MLVVKKIIHHDPFDSLFARSGMTFKFSRSSFAADALLANPATWLFATRTCGANWPSATEAKNRLKSRTASWTSFLPLKLIRPRQ